MRTLLWQYKYTTLLLISILIAYALSRSNEFHLFLHQLGGLGYLGAFLGGILFVYTFTFATGLVILVFLLDGIAAWEIALVGGLGAVVGDLVIFRFVKHDILSELIPLYHQLGGRKLSGIFYQPILKWILPVIGALIIASPFPDELGVSLLGISQIKTPMFIILSFSLNAIGIYLIISVSTLIMH